MITRAPYGYFVDLAEHFRSQMFPEFHQKRWNERRFLLIFRKTDEVLAVRVLCDLFEQSLVGVIVLLLDYQ